MQAPFPAELSAHVVRLNPSVLPVRQLQGYQSDKNGGLSPIWGDTAALYHPLTAELLKLDQTDKLILSALLEQTEITVLELFQQLSIQPLPFLQAIQQFSAHQLLYEESSKNSIDIVLPPEKLEIYVNLTSACNMSCDNCAVGIDVMPAGTARTVSAVGIADRLRRIFDSASQRGITDIKLKWAGGEPLLAAPGKVIAKLQQVLSELSTQYPSIRVDQVVLTNGGRITESAAQKLSEWKIRASVSLWGVGEKNDLLRHIKTKKDSYKNIIKNLELLQLYNVPFNIHHVITPYDQQTFAELITALWDPRSKTYIPKNWVHTPATPIRMGINFLRPQDANSLQYFVDAGYGQLLESVRHGFSVWRDLIVAGIATPPLTKLDYLVLDAFSARACGSGASYVVLDDQQVVPCHELLQPMTKDGNVPPPADLIKAANNHYTDADRLSMLGKNMLFPPTIPLPVLQTLKFHGGTGCPHSNWQEHGQLSIAGSITNKVYAPLLEEMLALEVLRS